MNKGDTAIAVFKLEDGPVHGKVKTIDVNRKYVVLEIADGIEHAGYYLDIKKGGLFDD